MKAKKTGLKKKRYDTSSRKEKSLLIRKKIIETYVKLLAARRGKEVKIEEVVRRSGIPERTIYRLFNDKESLSAATDEYTQSYLIRSAEHLVTLTVPEFTSHIYRQFDEYEQLVLAYLYSRFGIESRTAFRRQFTQIIIKKILTEKKLTLTRERKLKLAVIVSLLNAKIWHDIRTDFGFSGSEIGQTVSEAVQLLIDQLN